MANERKLMKETFLSVNIIKISLLRTLPFVHLKKCKSMTLR